MHLEHAVHHRAVVAAAAFLCVTVLTCSSTSHLRCARICLTNATRCVGSVSGGVDVDGDGGGDDGTEFGVKAADQCSVGCTCAGDLSIRLTPVLPILSMRSNRPTRLSRL